MDKDLLFKPRLPEANVDIAGVGTVRVRGLSNAEAMLVGNTNNAATKQRKMLARGMVDPELTEAEVGQWMKAAPAGEVERVAYRISELSGMLTDAAKEQYKSFRDGSGAGVHVLPGAEARDDGGPAASGDE